MMKNKTSIIVCFLFGFVYSQELDSIQYDSIQIIELNPVLISKKKEKFGYFEINVPSKVLENESLIQSIRRVEFITVSNNNELYFQNKKISTIYLNGKPVSIQEFQNLKLDELRKWVIDKNKFNQQTGEIETALLITQKKKIEDYFDGSISASHGFFQNFNYFGVNINNKSGQISSILNLGTLFNETDNNFNQQFNSEYLYSDRTRTLKQPFYSLQNTFELSPKALIYMKNTYSIVDDLNKNNVSNGNQIDYSLNLKRYALNLRYEQKLKHRFDLNFNFDYINVRNEIESNTFNNAENYNQFSNQRFNEITFSPILNKKGNKYTLLYALVLTNRDFFYKNNEKNNQYSQWLFTHYGNVAFELGKKHYLSLGVRYQFEKNDIENKSNHYFLPDVLFASEIDSLTNFDIAYKKRIIRPSIGSTSNSTYIDEYGNQLINPSFLKPQINNEVSITINRKFERFRLGINANYTHSKDYLGGLAKIENQNYYYEKHNLDKYSKLSGSISFAIPLYRDGMLNLSYTLSGVRLGQKEGIQEGFVNQYNISFSGSVFKNYLLSFDSFYIDKFYDGNTIYKAKPDFGFSISRNLLNKKLNLSLELRNVLDNDSYRELTFKENYNYYHISSHNQSRLFLISATYNFGKPLNIKRKYIQDTNTDMKLK